MSPTGQGRHRAAEVTSPRQYGNALAEALLQSPSAQRLLAEVRDPWDFDKRGSDIEVLLELTRCVAAEQTGLTNGLDRNVALYALLTAAAKVDDDLGNNPMRRRQIEDTANARLRSMPEVLPPGATAQVPDVEASFFGHEPEPEPPTTEILEQPPTERNAITR